MQKQHCWIVSEAAKGTCFQKKPTGWRYIGKLTKLQAIMGHPLLSICANVCRRAWLLTFTYFCGVVLLTLPADGFYCWSDSAMEPQSYTLMYYALQTPEELSSYTKSFCLSLSNTRVHAGPGPYWLRLSLTNTHTDLICSTLHILCGVTTPCPAPFPQDPLFLCPPIPMTAGCWKSERTISVCMFTTLLSVTHILSLIHTSAVTHFLCVFTAQGCIKLIESQSEDIYNVTKIYFLILFLLDFVHKKKKID